MYGKYFKTKMQKRLTFSIGHVTLYAKGGNLMAGRKSKYSSNENIVSKKIWSVALYIRLSQEDEDNRKRKARKQ